MAYFGGCALYIVVHSSQGECACIGIKQGVSRAWIEVSRLADGTRVDEVTAVGSKHNGTGVLLVIHRRYDGDTAVLLLFENGGSVCVAEEAELPFTDVGAKKWFYDAVKYVYDGELMNGTSADKFEPNGKLSRAMFITILGRLAGAETKESNVFPDIKKNSWYSGYVGWAVEAGVVKGYDDGTFKPNKSLSRQEMAVAVDRFITYLDCRMTQEGGQRMSRISLPTAKEDLPLLFSNSGESITSRRETSSWKFLQ